MATSQANSSTGKYWLFFAISMAACVAFLIFKPEWCWVTFPFVGTYLVKAFDMM